MSDATLDRVIAQCEDFIRDPENNYMLEVFNRKIADYGVFSEDEQSTLSARHKSLITEQLIPAYQKLIDGLEKLRGTGTNDQGLAHFEGGQEYYLYLLRSNVGTYDSVETIRQRLLEQLSADMQELRALIRSDSSLVQKISNNELFSEKEPEDMMSMLQNVIQEDFPPLEETSFELCYVDSSMEDYLSPAFYLTPPLDTGTPNVIYINNRQNTAELDLFTTLAHEGFPGHLYQTVYFQKLKPSAIRCLFDSSGYVEGWATYVESYAFQYAGEMSNDENAAALTRAAWLNRSITLNMYSLLDLGIHYDGWSQEQTARFLRAFGIQTESVLNEIYRYIVETPGNYLKYYWGYLNFQDLKEQKMEELGDAFDLQAFHRAVLEVGPVAFPVLEKYLDMYL
jgi:uncharacterized protein (DUF885 family)